MRSTKSSDYYNEYLTYDDKELLVKHFITAVTENPHKDIDNIIYSIGDTDHSRTEYIISFLNDIADVIYND
jgi:hypothetical protein